MAKIRIVPIGNDNIIEGDFSNVQEAKKQLAKQNPNTKGLTAVCFYNWSDWKQKYINSSVSTI